MTDRLISYKRSGLVKDRVGVTQRITLEDIIVGSSARRVINEHDHGWVLTPERIKELARRFVTDTAPELRRQFVIQRSESISGALA